MTGHLPKFRAPNLPDALCYDSRIDPELFYAGDVQQPEVEIVEQAREICLSCVERQKCLLWALQYERYGMWGGMTAMERRDFKSRRMNKLQHLVELGII